MKKIPSIRFAAIFGSLWVKMNETASAKYSLSFLRKPQKIDKWTSSKFQINFGKSKTRLKSFYIAKIADM